MIRTVAQMIADKGGPAAFAAAVGKTAGAARLWKHRNCFPREVWPEIIQTFPDITLDRLIEAEGLPAHHAPAGSAPAEFLANAAIYTGDLARGRADREERRATRAEAQLGKVRSPMGDA